MAVSVELVEGVAVRVLVIVLVVEGVAVIVLVEESEAGTTVGLTDAASLPTVKSTPQT